LQVVQMKQIFGLLAYHVLLLDMALQRHQQVDIYLPSGNLEKNPSFREFELFV
jgi:hypothetical protein